jgi:DNA-binding NarL/FixJ family response regulator
MTGTDSLHVESLTVRERQVAHAVARGLRNRQIAQEFGISEETVKKHLATIYGKLGLSGRVALAVHVLQTTDGGERAVA